MFIQGQRPPRPTYQCGKYESIFFVRSAMAPSNIEIGGRGDLTVVHGICSYALTMVVVYQIGKQLDSKLVKQSVNQLRNRQSIS